MTSVERVVEYSQLPPEEEFVNSPQLEDADQVRSLLSFCCRPAAGVVAGVVADNGTVCRHLWPSAMRKTGLKEGN